MKTMTVEYLKQLFIERFDDYIFIDFPRVNVTLTRAQYRELSIDIEKHRVDSLSLIDDDDIPIDLDTINHCIINIPGVCTLRVEMGNSFRMIADDGDYGEETL